MFFKSSGREWEDYFELVIKGYRRLKRLIRFALESLDKSSFTFGQ